ncbi:MAG: hypothetical protein JRD49_05875 [Deltaproteobacteria bacterium]|nr:hypothetical protein [Deltaproteobacteria bacterium]
MAEKKQNALIRQRILGLQEKRKTLMDLPAEQVVEKILDSERPVELVHSFPEEDLYLLVNEIGPEDAQPVISLASAKQWEYMLDMDIWEGDRVNPIAATRWLNLLLASDPDRLSRWCAEEKKEFTEFFLYHNLDVGIREEDQDPSDFGKEFSTFDDVFYFRVKALSVEMGTDDDPEADETREHFKNQRKKFFPMLLQKIAAHDFQWYRNLLMESASIIPAETEEELYRLRNVRLAEKGFLPREEAVGVYQSIKPQDLAGRPVKFTESESESAALPVTPLSSGAMLEENTPLGRALASIDHIQLKMQLQSEFAGLCNSIIAADGTTIQTRQALAGIVKKACGYISIGLENLPDDHRHLIRTYPLSDIFRVGYGQALALKWRAESWQKSSWYVKTGLRLDFWGETFMGVIGGLLIQKPLFFDNYATGTLYREFQNADDIRSTKKLLDGITSLDKLFHLLQIENIPKNLHPPLTYKNLLLTLWTAHCLGLPEQPQTVTGIPLKVFRSFFSGLWDTHKKPPIISREIKASFRDWITSAGQIDGNKFSDTFGEIFTDLFKEIEEEYAQVSAEDLDPRFIHLFRLEA